MIDYIPKYIKKKKVQQKTAICQHDTANTVKGTRQRRGSEK